MDDAPARLNAEGVTALLASLCSPPTGRLKEVYEDPQVLGRLAERYNTLMRSLIAGEIIEDDVSTWYRDNYFDFGVR